MVRTSGNGAWAVGQTCRETGALEFWGSYPCNKGLLATWHALVKGLSASEDLQKHHPKAVHATPPRQHAHGRIPAPSTAGEDRHKSILSNHFDLAYLVLCRTASSNQSRSTRTNLTAASRQTPGSQNGVEQQGLTQGRCIRRCPGAAWRPCARPGRGPHC